MTRHRSGLVPDAPPSRRGRDTLPELIGPDDRRFPDAVRRRLASTLPGLAAQLRMAPRPIYRPDPALESTLRPAAALLLIYPHNDEWHVPLTVRGAGLRHHTGQVALPGGRLDHPQETIEQAALREAHEEIGVVPADVEVLGRLTPIPVVVSGHLLQPVVGVARQRPSFSVAAAEVERLIELPLTRLLQHDAVEWEERMRMLPPGGMMNVPYFAVEGARVWGATAMVLAEFIALIEELEPELDA
jgi:8-oxo-dGTP pyrophosphatase MutT (NUDIX family)